MTNEQIKIIHIHDYAPFEGGGIEVNTHYLCEEQSKLGYNVTLLFPSDRLQQPNVLNQTRPYVVIPISDKAQIEKYCQIAEIINIHFAFDIGGITLDAIETCLRLEKKVIVSIRKPYSAISHLSLGNLLPAEQKEYLSRVTKLLNNPLVTIMGPAQSLQSTLKTLGVHKTIQLIRNGLAKPPTSNDSVNTKQITPVDVTFIGNISRVKGTFALLNALPKVVKKFSHYKVRIIGYSSEFNTVQVLIKNLLLTNNVELIPYIEHKDVPRYLQQTSLYLQPSLSEAWGNIVAEALSMGIPTITSAVDGLPELMNNGVFGALLPNVSSQSIYNALIRFKTDETFQNSLKSKARSAATYINQHYTIRNQANSLTKLYKKVLVSN